LHAEAASAAVRTRRRRRTRVRLTVQWAVFVSLLAVFAAVALGVVFAGSSERIAAGVSVAGVDVGGLSPKEARTLLERRAKSLANVPVTFTAGSGSWQLRPARMGVEVDWAGAIDTAQRQGNALGPLRGLRRIEVRVFGSDITPPTRVYAAALDYRLDRIERAISRPPREAAVAFRGLRPVLVPGANGLSLDREAAEGVVVRALAGLERKPIALPVTVERQTVEKDELRPALEQARTAVAAPVRLTLGETRWRLPRWRVAELLAPPRDGERRLRIGGGGADRYFGRLERRVNRAPRDSTWAVSGAKVRVVPARSGLEVDVRETARRLLEAALSPSRRVARLAVATKPATRSTAQAAAMGITGLVASYQTYYGGDANRIHNVQLVARLVDDKLIAPGAAFSFNETTGERTAERGFLEAPVIINGELQTGLGGGVCQVSTTVFNAAYEAGLPITARTNHALYISHYPQGRDATVNYPDLDLKFVNDTGKWLWLRTYVGASSLVVALYGAPTGRRVETVTSPLEVTGPPTVERISDPTLARGTTVVEDSGEPSRRTSVTRKVFDARGKLILENAWYSSYRSEKQVVRVGTKPPPKTTPSTTTEEPAEEPKPKPKPEPKPESQAPRERARGLGLGPQP
jgi:vancomycin resistance protein YoaR